MISETLTLSLQLEAAQEKKEHPQLSDEEAYLIAEQHKRLESGYEGDLPYTRDGLIEELRLIQRHASDGSAFMGCKCIQKKHLAIVAGQASEGVALAPGQKEKEFYAWLSPWARKTRDHVEKTVEKKDREAEKSMWIDLASDAREISKEIDGEGFNIPNPASKRAYLPSGLTEEERQSAALRSKLSSCIKQTEISCCGAPTSDYTGCSCNPVAVCRASVGG